MSSRGSWETTWGLGTWLWRNLGNGLEPKDGQGSGKDHAYAASLDPLFPTLPVICRRVAGSEKG